MAPDSSSKLPIAKDFDVLMNKIDIELAKRKQLFAPYIEEYAKKFPSRKTQEQLDAEDSQLFQPQPPYLGLGCSIPKDWQTDGEVSRKRALGQAIFGKKFGLQASKQRDVKERAGSAKRGLDRESSDEDEGRSALGKTKKVKVSSQPLEHGKAFEKGHALLQDHEDGVRSNQVIRPALPHKPQMPRILQTKQDIKGKKGLEESSLQEQKKPSPVKVSLVDYPSDDQGNDSASAGSETSSFKAPALPHSSQKPKLNIDAKKTADIANHEVNEDNDNASAGSKSSSVKSVTSEDSTKKRTLNKDGKVSKTPDHSSPKPMPKVVSRASSMASKNLSTTSTSSESDQSDLETVIPTPLVADVVAAAFIPTINAKDSNFSPTEIARKQKNRDKKAKAKERKRREKEAAALASANLGTGTTSVVPVVLQAKKLKDRLLDANGN